MLKLKRVLTTMLAAVMPISVTAFGADTVTVPLKIDKSVCSSVTGYLAELEYDNSVLEPIIKGQNLLQEDNYSAPSDKLSERGIFTASNTGGVIKIGWADHEEYNLSEDTETLANIEFKVLDPNATNTVVVTKWLSIADKPTSLLNSLPENVASTVLDKKILGGSGKVNVDNKGGTDDVLPKVDIITEETTESTTDIVEVTTDASVSVDNKGGVDDLPPKIDIVAEETTESTTEETTESTTEDTTENEEVSVDDEVAVSEDYVTSDDSISAENDTVDNQLKELATVELDE